MVKKCAPSTVNWMIGLSLFTFIFFTHLSSVTGDMKSGSSSTTIVKETAETTGEPLRIKKINLGKSIQLICSKPKSQLKYSIQWEKPKGVIIRRGSHLTLGDITPVNRGAYFCRARTILKGKRIEEMASIQLEQYINQKPVRAAQLISDLTRVIITEGNYLNVEPSQAFLRAQCIVRGEEEENYDIKWYNPLQIVTGNEGILYVPFGDVSEVVGEYKCEATHRSSGEKISDILRVVSTDVQPKTSGIGPHFQVQIQHVEPNKLRCYTEPPTANAQYEWIVKGRIVSTDPIITLNGVSSTEKYHCRVKVLDSVEKDWWVIISASEISLKPEREYEPSTLGSRFILKCEVDDRMGTGSDVQWYFNDQPLYSINMSNLNCDRVDSNDMSQLVLKNIQQQNEGTYKCQLNSGIVKYVMVGVESDKVEITPTKVERKERQDAEFTCKYTGGETVSFQWFFLGENPDDPQRALREGWLLPLTFRNRIEQMSRIVLEDVKLSDSGYYRCITSRGEYSTGRLVVRNSGDGEDEIIVAVDTKKVKVRPNEEFTVKCTVRRNGQLYGSPVWRFSNGTHSLEADSSFRIIPLREGESELRIRDLSPSNSIRRIECLYRDKSDWLALERESDCDESLMFLCGNGRCIDRRSMCNSYDDCGDNTDESVHICNNRTKNIHIFVSPREVRFRPGSSAASIECTSLLDGQFYGYPQWKFENQPHPIEYVDRRFSITDRSIGRITVSFQRLTQSDNSLRLECALEDRKDTAVIYVESLCDPREFRCRNGQCIPQERRCDTRRDCDDSSDEDSCSGPTAICDPLELKCEVNNRGAAPTRQYYSPSWRCDGENDCGNNFDEMNCHTDECSRNLFECSSNGPSIPKAFVCDKESECPNGQDEVNCRAINILQSDRRIRRVSLGETVQLTCKVVGHPLPSVIWRFNWNCLRDPSRMTVSHRNMAGCSEVESTLVIRNFQQGDDGIYNCEAITSRQRAISDDYQVILQMQG